MDILQNIKCSIPENPLLQKQIAYYYFLEQGQSKEPLEFKYYPHYYSTLNFYKNAQIDIKGRTRQIDVIEDNGIQCIYSNNIDQAKKTVINDALNVIGIVFQPLGFNYFFPNQIHSGHQEYFLEIPKSRWAEQVNTIYSERSTVVKTQLLDRLFASLFVNLHVPILQRAIDLLLHYKGDVELVKLSKHLGVSRRTILRYFKQYLGYSFIDFKAVVKFRFALKEGVKGKGKLSALAYEYNYYDQSDFTKHFKAKTNETPKKLMNSVTQVTEELFWKLNSPG